MGFVWLCHTRIIARYITDVQFRVRQPDHKGEFRMVFISAFMFVYPTSHGGHSHQPIFQYALRQPNHKGESHMVEIIAA